MSLNPALANSKSKREKNAGPNFDVVTHLDNKLKSLSERESMDKLRHARRSSAHVGPNRQEKISMQGKGQLLPSINTSNQMTSGRRDENSPKKNHGISTNGGTTLMSYREQGFYTSKEKAELKVGEQRRDIHNSFVLQSNHYKWNRIKEGGWGTINRNKPEFPHLRASRNLQSCATEGATSVVAEKNKLDDDELMASLGRLQTSDFLISTARKNQQVFGRDEQLEFQA